MTSGTRKARNTPPRGASTGEQAPFELKPWHIQAIVTAFALFFFRDILLGKAFLWEDFLYYSYPVRSFAATSMAMGQFPLWNPYTFNGIPFLADIQTTVLYLPCTVLALAVKNGSLHFGWLELVIVLHYVLAGISMAALARFLELRPVPSLFAGVAFMLSGFMIVHSIHQQIITLVAWYPLITLLFLRALRDRRWFWVFLAALALGHSIFAGYPQLSLYFYLFLFALFVFELLRVNGPKGLLKPPALVMSAQAATIVILSVAVAMVQLLPTAELADLSQRSQITYEKASEGSLAWSQLLTLVQPKMFGAAGPDAYAYYGPGTYWYYWETCIYLGALPLMLSILSLRRVRSKALIAFLWGVAAFALLYALGANFFLHKLFYDFVPGFSRFRNPARIGIFLGFATALLSAFSLQEILDNRLPENDRRKIRKLLLVMIGAGIALWLMIVSGVLSGILPFLSDPQIAATINRNALIGVAVWTISGGLLILLLKPGPLLRWSVVLLPGIFLIDMLLFGGNQSNGKVNPAEYFGRSERLVRFLKQQGEQELFRINTRNSQGMIVDRNQGMVDRIFTMEGYTPLALQRTYAPMPTDKAFDLLNVKYKTVTEQNRGLNFVPNPTALPRAFLLHRIHIAPTDTELVAYLQNPDFDHRTTAVLEKEPGFTLSVPDSAAADSVRITGYENNSIALDVHAAANGLLVLSEIHYPGWKGFVDGRESEVFRTDYHLRGLFVPRGTHRVEVRFVPASFERGGILTLAALLVCIGGGAFSLLRSRKHA
jgi:hypothetical protein